MEEAGDHPAHQYLLHYRSGSAACGSRYLQASGTCRRVLAALGFAATLHPNQGQPPSIWQSLPWQGRDWADWVAASGARSGDVVAMNRQAGQVLIQLRPRQQQARQARQARQAQQQHPAAAPPTAAARAVRAAGRDPRLQLADRPLKVKGWRQGSDGWWRAHLPHIACGDKPRIGLLGEGPAQPRCSSCCPGSCAPWPGLCCARSMLSYLSPHARSLRYAPRAGSAYEQLAGAPAAAPGSELAVEAAAGQQYRLAYRVYEGSAAKNALHVSGRGAAGGLRARAGWWRGKGLELLGAGGVGGCASAAANPWAQQKTNSSQASCATNPAGPGPAPLGAGQPRAAGRRHFAEARGQRPRADPARARRGAAAPRGQRPARGGRGLCGGSGGHRGRERGGAAGGRQRSGRGAAWPGGPAAGA